jgi:predicted O-methyltransferase YrrM
MKIIHPDLDKYLHEITPGSDEILKKMERLAEEKDFPIVGSLVGRMLYQLVKLMDAKKIFEMGSGFGYSAYWMAQAISEGGKIICTEIAENYCELGERFLEEGGVKDKVEYRLGDSMSLLNQEKDLFDIIFNDVDKYQYPDALEVAMPRLRKGGLLMTDNVLWDGKVLDEHPDQDTAGVLEYTKRIYSDKRLWSIIVPIRDGVSISMKL